MIRDFAVWLNDTRLSLLFKETSWIVPAVQAVHILAIGVVLSAFVMLTARVYGLAARGVAIGSLNRRFLPWVWWSVAVLASTGVVMIVAEPGRALPNPFFQAKLAMIAVIVALLIGYRGALGRGADGDTRAVFPVPVRALFAAVTAMTLLIIFCGRWIAYSEGAPIL